MIRKVNVALNLNDISNEANNMCNNPNNDVGQKKGNVSNGVKYSQSPIINWSILPFEVYLI